MIRERRASDLADCAAVLRLVHDTDRYPLNWPADPITWLAPPEESAAWVAVVDGAVAGHIAVHQKAEKSAELARLFVGPAARRTAVGRDLVRVVRDWAFQRGYALTLNVTDHGGRRAATAFYEATGWTYTHTTTAGWTGPDGGPVRLRHYRSG